MYEVVGIYICMRRLVICCLYMYGVVGNLHIYWSLLEIYGHIWCGWIPSQVSIFYCVQWKHRWVHQVYASSMSIHKEDTERDLVYEYPQRRYRTRSRVWLSIEETPNAISRTTLKRVTFGPRPPLSNTKVTVVYCCCHCFWDVHVADTYSVCCAV